MTHSCDDGTEILSIRRFQEYSLIGLLKAVDALWICGLESVGASAFDDREEHERIVHDRRYVGEDDASVCTTVNLAIVLLADLATRWIIREIRSLLEPSVSLGDIFSLN